MDKNMKTNNMDSEMWSLVTLYLSDNATPAEREKVELWVNESNENKNIFEKAKKIWESSKIAAYAGIDVNAAWKNVDNKAKITSKSKTRNLYSLPVKYALRIAAIVCIGLFSWYLISTFSAQKTVLAGNVLAQIELSDGSHVNLNKQASLKFNKMFSGKTREVYLKGEAFFHVARNVEKPFIIHTANADIKVLGTSFNVNTSENGDLEVVVNSGTVSVTSKETKSQVILHKDDKAIYSARSGSLVKTINGNPNYLAWKTFKLIFKETSLNEVITNVEKVYGIKVNISDTSLLNCRLTATYDNLKADELLQMVGKTFGFNIKATNNSFYFEGKNCKKQ